jgi:DNA-binding GntR family transcriptional regulator
MKRGRRSRGREAVRVIGRTFLYASLADELRRRIVDGLYEPGRPIPTEGALMREFKVSAITVRRALRELTFEGMLFGRQGLGVFVADRRRIVRVLSGDSRPSIGDEIRRAGLEPSIKELAWAPVREPDVARRLGLTAHASVHRHEKLILADGEPVSIDVVYLPRDLGDRLRSELTDDFVFPLLAKAGIAVAHSEFQFEGGAVSAEDAALLGVAVRAPLIRVHYTLYAPGGAPILTGVTTARSDRFIFALSLGGPRPGRRGANGGARAAR